MPANQNPTQSSGSGAVSAPEMAHEPTPRELARIAAEENARYARERVRASIHNHAGDPLSMLGTVADVAQMLLVWHCELVEAAKNATSLAQLKAAITASPLAAETAKLVADTKAGNVRWPYQLKGAVKVTDDVERRATIAHDAIQAGPKAKL